MKISEFIKKLEEAKEKYGDITVARFNYDTEQGNYHELVTSIKLIKTDKYQFGDFSTPYIYIK